MAFRHNQSIYLVNGKIKAGTYVLPVRVNGHIDSARIISKDITGIFNVYDGDPNQSCVIYYFPTSIKDYDGFICRKDSITVDF